MKRKRATKANGNDEGNDETICSIRAAAGDKPHLHLQETGSGWRVKEKMEK